MEKNKYNKGEKVRITLADKEGWEKDLEDLFYDKEDLSSAKKFIKLLLLEKEKETREKVLKEVLSKLKE